LWRAAAAEERAIKRAEAVALVVFSLVREASP
jgi:hypothetical protein